MTNSEDRFSLSVLEADVLVAIDNIGWYAYLWFPIVQREVLNFGAPESDEQVHAAFARLIRKGALIETATEPGDFPQWSPAPGILEIARNTVSLGRDLRSRGK